jgi:hypothetical protein
MDMLTDVQIAEADLSDRRKLGQAVSAGGTVVDDSQAPSYTVIADHDGKKAWRVHRFRLRRTGDRSRW